MKLQIRPYTQKNNDGIEVFGHYRPCNHIIEICTHTHELTLWVLIHELLHQILHEFVDFETSKALDNVSKELDWGTEI